jgi:hypothetical protein
VIVRVCPALAPLVPTIVPWSNKVEGLGDRVVTIAAWLDPVCAVIVAARPDRLKVHIASPKTCVHAAW